MPVKLGLHIHCPTGGLQVVPSLPSMIHLHNSQQSALGPPFTQELCCGPVQLGSHVHLLEVSHSGDSCEAFVARAHSLACLSTAVTATAAVAQGCIAWRASPLQSLLQQLWRKGASLACLSTAVIATAVVVQGR